MALWAWLPGCILMWLVEFVDGLEGVLRARPGWVLLVLMVLLLLLAASGAALGALLIKSYTEVRKTVLDAPSVLSWPSSPQLSCLMAVQLMYR